MSSVHGRCQVVTAQKRIHFTATVLAMDRHEVVGSRRTRWIARTNRVIGQYSRGWLGYGTVMRYFLSTGPKTALAFGVVQPPAAGAPIAGAGPLK
jgi:hypothetical protein